MNIMRIYGNPHYEHIQLLNNSELVRVWEARGIFAPLLQMPYPDETISGLEIQYLMKLQSLVDSHRVEHCRLIDEHLFEMWREYLLSLGLSPSADLYQEVAVFDPVIDYLKMRYNRPRPFQLAGTLGLPLYPLAQHGSTDSAYPGGHVLLSLFVYHKYCQVAPELKNALMMMVLDVKRSREDLGLHYPSDGLFAFQVYKHIKPYMTATPLHI